MADIKYTPSELLAQSAEMSALQSEYDALFVKTTSALNGLNESWSENLSRNFSGKIQSAQKSFSSIINMLSNGSIAAKLGATSHSPTSIESFFSSLGGADKLGTGGLDQIFSNLTDEDKKRLYDALPKEVKAMIKTSQDVDKYLAEKYGSLPEPMRKSIEAIIPSDGNLQVLLGSFDYYEEPAIPVSASNDFQIIDVVFQDFRLLKRSKEIAI